MTNEETVKAIYPNAYVKLTRIGRFTHTVRLSKKSSMILGQGTTEAEAWKMAAKEADKHRDHHSKR